MSKNIIIPKNNNIQSKCHELYSSWNVYYHLPDNSNWDLNSYIILYKNINSLEQSILIQNAIPPIIFKSTMLFIMRDGITPMWEDPQNRNGGCFSYKVSNRYVCEVWKTIFYMLIGGTIFKNNQYEPNINGITLSPKRNFCVLKIWLKDNSIQNPELVSEINGLTYNGALFKSHSPEF